MYIFGDLTSKAIFFSVCLWIYMFYPFIRFDLVCDTVNCDVIYILNVGTV